MRTWLILFSLAFGLTPLVCSAASGSELIETFPTGHIDWTRGVVAAKGSASGALEVNPNSREKLSADAYLRAIFNVRATLSRLRMAGGTSIADLMDREDRTRNEVSAMASAADIVKTVHRDDGGVDVFVQLVLHGGFAQFMLPEEIRQVEPIKPLNGNAPGKATESGLGPGVDMPSEDPAEFTGLIVDACGIGAQPAMVPVLYDENGQEVYSPAFVSREYAVQYGVCQYRQPGGNVAEETRVAPNPLVVRGLRTSPNARSEIVISNADAAMLRSSSAHLGFLKQCRVVILID